MTRAEYQMPSGATVTIEDGSPEEIAKTVQLLEESLSPTPPAKKKTKRTKQAKAEKPSVRALILELRDGGFFADGKSLPEVREALRHKKGYKLKSRDISKPLTRLVRDDELKREGVVRKYKYFEPS